MSTINVKCSCGSDNFEMPKNPQANDKIKCARCGATGKYGDAMKAAKSAIEKQLKDAFKKARFK